VRASEFTFELLRRDLPAPHYRLPTGDNGTLPLFCYSSPLCPWQQFRLRQSLRAPPAELAKQETDPFWRTYALALAQFANGDGAEADAALKKLIDDDGDDARQPDRHNLYPAQGLGEDVPVAGARVDDARRGCDRAVARSFPARLQGRPALHRLRAKDRGDAESRRQAMSAFTDVDFDINHL
jgi:hypothetical protein